MVARNDDLKCLNLQITDERLDILDNLIYNNKNLEEITLGSVSKYSPRGIDRRMPKPMLSRRQMVKVLGLGKPAKHTQINTAMLIHSVAFFHIIARL